MQWTKNRSSVSGQPYDNDYYSRQEQQEPSGEGDKTTRSCLSYSWPSIEIESGVAAHIAAEPDACKRQDEKNGNPPERFAASREV